MTSFQKSYTVFMENVCNEFKCLKALPVLTKGFKTFCEAISQDSIQPNAWPIEVSHWYYDNHSYVWKRAMHEQCISMERAKYHADKIINYLKKYNTDVKISKMYKGDMHGKTHGNQDYFCIKITGRNNSGEYTSDVITFKRNMYEDFIHHPGYRDKAKDIAYRALKAAGITAVNLQVKHRDSTIIYPIPMGSETPLDTRWVVDYYSDDRRDIRFLVRQDIVVDGTWCEKPGCYYIISDYELEPFFVQEFTKLQDELNSKTSEAVSASSLNM